MEYFPAILSAAESDALIDKIEGLFETRGFGLYAVESKSGGDFIGFTGLSTPSFDAHFTPCVEIGWRLAWDYWGKGYATEAARVSLEHAFGKLGLEEVVAMAVATNYRSRRVMEKLGMTWNPVDDFDHPRIPEGHPLRRHVLYRKRRVTAS
jgi:RimJ/RimL family protein N-acetyltransferase